MRIDVRRAVVALSGLVVVASLTVAGQRSSSVAPADATAKIVAAAQAVAASLDDAGRAQLQFRFDDAEQKVRWSNLPSPMFGRKGIKLGDLTPPQRAAVTALLQTALSADGYRKVTEIMRGDEVLRTNGGGRGGGGRGAGGGGGPAFGQDEYYLAFLGTPSTTTPWLMQYGGHHLAINLTLGGAQASMTPSLPAAQPATYTFEGKEIRPLGKENDKAFALINALEPDKRSQAILAYRVSDLVLGAGKDGRVIQPEGLRGSALSSAQQTMLLDIVREWAGIMHDAYAEVRMAEIRRNLPDTYFAWSGPTTNGSVAYFRIQGPTLVIEYAPQGSVDHIHTIYRDPTNDYGAKFAAK
jgi:Protein of unknown function (DUF3500)